MLLLQAKKNIAERRHCNKKLTRNSAFPLKSRTKQIACCVDAEGESMSVRQGVTGRSSMTTAGCTVHRAFFDRDRQQRTDGRRTDGRTDGRTSTNTHIWPLRRTSNDYQLGL